MLDRASMTTSLAFISAPVFWLGLVALYLFADDIGQFPIFPGQGSFATASTRLTEGRIDDPALARAGGRDLRGLRPATCGPA